MIVEQEKMIVEQEEIVLNKEEIVLNKKKSYLSKIRWYESLNKRRIIAILQEIPKQSIQRAYEHIPYTHFIDLYREKWLLSQTPIPKWSIWYKGRQAITIPQSGIVGELCLNGKKILYEAQTNISDIFQWEIPENISIDMAIMMISIVLWTTIYWLTVKPGDAIQLGKKYSQEQENITVS
jgi:hypothetical protein